MLLNYGRNGVFSLWHLRIVLIKCLAHPVKSNLNRLFLKAEKNSIHLLLEDTRREDTDDS